VAKTIRESDKKRQFIKGRGREGKMGKVVKKMG
jgi:hypothetical protein